MTLTTLNGLLMFAVALVAAADMVYWWVKTRGTWRQWPAGRSLMGLLFIIVLISGWAGLNTSVFPKAYAWKSESYALLYLLLFTALLVIGFTIRSEMRKGKAPLYSKDPAQTGPVKVILASTNEESPVEETP